MAHSELNRKLIACLLEHGENPLFLQKAYQILKSDNAKINYASLARKMRFSSRSFVRHLFLAQRQPNLKNYKQISEGLGFSSDMTTYFGVLLEKKGMLGAPSVHFENRLNEAERKLRINLNKKIQKIRKKDPVPFDRWPFIYASLGSFEQGRTIQEIVEISGQSLRVCIEILDDLVNKDLVAFDKPRQKYFPKNEIINIEELSHSPILKSFYKMICLDSLRRIDKELSHENTLFHSAVFSVKKENIPALTRDLQNLLSSYMQKAEDSSGEQLALLSASLLPLQSQ